MKFKSISFILITYIFLAFDMRSQTSNQEGEFILDGILTDESNNEAIVGASVQYEVGKGVVTDLQGHFNLSLPNGNYTLSISYIGYSPYKMIINIDGKNKSLGSIRIQNANNLDEVEIAADIAKTRETPIAFSDVNMKQISEELGANDLPMLLNSTPGAYASQQGGGAGDSRVNIRGFDQRNVAVLVDGVPVNDMENGQVYWSNWAGLSEITKKMQVQRGLGASRLALPSVGGVMNIITKSVDQEPYFVIKNDMGTANYQRFSLGYNSGLIKNKLGITLAGSYTGGDGYIDQTWQKTWSYFGKVSFKINSKNLLIFGFNGSPQSHGQRSFAINMAFNDLTFAMNQGINADSLYALTSSNSMNKYTNKNTGARGISYSPDWGYINGKVVNAKINYFHKPLLNLSYFLHINSRLSFTNVFYLSHANGGATTLSYFPQYDKNGTGQLTMQSLYDVNVSTPMGSVTSGTLIPGQRPSAYFQYASINQHKWIGTLSTFKYKHSQKLDFLGGLDARYYVGTHYQTPYNMLGGDYVISTSDININRSNKNPETAKYIGDKINYYYQSKITWTGLFGQVEYKADRITAFATITGNQTGFQIINYFAKKDIVLDPKTIIFKAVGYGDTLYTDGKNTGVQANGTPVTHNSDGTITFKDNISNQNITVAQNFKAYTNTSSNARANTSPVKNYIGYTIKGGLNYKLNRSHNVFFNFGQMNLAPRFSNIYDRSGASVNNVTNQKILTGELGYSIKYSNIAINLNGYLTNWGNRPSDFALTSSQIDPVTQTPYYYNVSGMNALLKGIEFDMSYKPIKNVEVRGFGMLADWRWNSSGTSFVISETGVKVDSTVFDAKGIHIGNAPQKQIGGSVRLELFKDFYIKPQFTFFDKMYAQFDPNKLVLDNSTKKDYRKIDAWKMPSFGVADLYMGYTIRSGKTVVNLIASMNNVMNLVYMTDAFYSSSLTADKYNAINSVGWMGLGRRINISAKVTF